MAKRTFQLISRDIFVAQKKVQVAELIAATVHCDFSDDADANNEFTYAIKSDADRFSESVRYDQNEVVETDHLGAERTGTISTTTFVTTGLVASAYVGCRAWAYVAGAESAGSWREIVSNTTTNIVAETAFAVGTNRLKIQSRKIRHNIQIVPQPGFYGSFFSHTLTKKIASDGNFKLFEIDYDLIPTNIDPEFLSGMGAIANAWE